MISRTGNPNPVKMTRSQESNGNKYKSVCSFSFAHRKDKKNDMRKLWNVKMNAALRELGTTYSKFINALKIKNIILDRKILADLAENNPEVFKKIVEAVK
jgi:large subunit ribosomal protein L20